MIVTRFAPSPTGDLHLGSVRTALFSWLYARHHGGKCILRIEDTDKERSTQASVDVILKGLEWLGLDFDGPVYYQSERTQRYAQIIQQLIETGHAYYCDCSKERLESLRTQQMADKQKPKYDRACLHKQLGPGPGRVVRFKQPDTGAVEIADAVYGNITVQNEELDDLIIAREDGSPTYNLCVVVDDWDMGMTHVIRGDDHINNTPRQMNLLQALGAPIPTYAHLPMILGEDGKRLSKRHGAASILAFQSEGFLPETMLNALVRLGWSDGDKEIFSREEMIARFSLSSVSRSAAVLDRKKLLWMNQQYLKSLPIEKIVPALASALEAESLSLEQGPALEKVLSVQRERAKTLHEIVEKSACFYKPLEDYEPDSAKAHLHAQSAPILHWVAEQLQACDWEKAALKAVVKAACSHFEVGFAQVAQPLRVALTGSTVSPSIDDTLFLMEKAVVESRLTKAIDWIEKNSTQAG